MEIREKNGKPNLDFVGLLLRWRKPWRTFNKQSCCSKPASAGRKVETTWDLVLLSPFNLNFEHQQYIWKIRCLSQLSASTRWDPIPHDEGMLSWISFAIDITSLAKGSQLCTLCYHIDSHVQSFLRSSTMMTNMPVMIVALVLLAKYSEAFSAPRIGQASQLARNGLHTQHTMGMALQLRLPHIVVPRLSSPSSLMGGYLRAIDMHNGDLQLPRRGK